MIPAGEKRLVVVLSDSQAALKATAKAEPNAAQDLFECIYDALDDLAKRGT